MQKKNRALIGKGEGTLRPKIIISTASNEALLSEYADVAGAIGWETTSAEMRFNEQYASELRDEVLKRMNEV